MRCKFFICRYSQLSLTCVLCSFQPPGKMHAVYTPVKTVAQGGHFFLYDALHQTEVARSVDHKFGNHTTNQHHYNAYETLNRMVLALPYLPADFGKLCLAVVVDEANFASQCYMNNLSSRS